ncbi:MAG: hypothetical protein IJX39_04100 [Clostridia bacterium]|nr:hypothetical protein [Clostridia bacterium]
MYPIPHVSGSKRLLAAFGAGALCALILPKAFFCILGASLLLVAGCSLSKIEHHKEC